MIESLARLYSRLAPTPRGTWRVARIARAFRRRSRWRDLFHTPDGLILDLDLATYPDCAMAFGLYELTVARLLKRTLRPGDHFIDGGANLGYFTLLAARLVGPTGRVDAFEPQPDNFARLAANHQRNGSPPHVHLHPLALSDRPGEITIHTYAQQNSSHNHGCASLYPEPGQPTHKHAVQAVRMDDHLASSSPRLIKLDLEGAEPLAIAGMTKLLQRDNPPTLIVERNPSQARLAGFDPDEFATRARTANPRYEITRLESGEQCNVLLKCPPAQSRTS